jgi:hypothetical protein
MRADFKMKMEDKANKKVLLPARPEGRLFFTEYLKW